MFRQHIHHCILSAVCLLLSGRLSAQEDDIRGPRALVEIPVPEKTPVALWWGIAGGLLLVALVAYFWRKRARSIERQSPLAVAMASLTELSGTRETLAAEAFANRAAQTVRQYLAAQFGLAAPKRTTEEFLQDLAKAEKSPLVSESDHLRAFLKSCDLAKFAGSNLDTRQRDELIQAARGFITTTSAPVIPPKNQGRNP